MKSSKGERHTGARLERIGWVTEDHLKGSRTRSRLVAGRVKLSPAEGYRCNPKASFIDFTGVRTIMTAKGERRDHSGKAQGALLVLLDYRKDVISKQKFEQHLFTKRSKY